MPKLDVFDSADQVPEALRPYYVEEDGRWYPDAEPLRERGQRAIAEERRRRAEYAHRAEELDRVAKEREARIAELERAAEPAEAAHEKQTLNARIKQLEATVTAREQKIKAQDQAIAERTITDTLRSAALEAGVSKEAVEDLVALPRFRQNWRIDAAGEPALFDGDVVRAEVSPKGYATEFLNQHKYWLPPSGGSGAQGGGNNRPAAGMVNATREQMKNPQFYQKVKADLEKQGLDIGAVNIIDSSQ